MMMTKSVPNRPAISNVLIKASANVVFRSMLLNDPRNALAGMDLPPEDAEILVGVRANNLRDYARQIKTILMQ